MCWLFAALNSREPPLSMLADIDFFTEDEEAEAKRRPATITAIQARLSQLEVSLGSKEYLVGDIFTVADVMTTSVFRVRSFIPLHSSTTIRVLLNIATAASPGKQMRRLLRTNAMPSRSIKLRI